MAERFRIEGPTGCLDVEMAGPDDGQFLVVHHGTPGAGTIFAPLVEVGAKRGLRHLTYPRPGYAGSDRSPGRKVADCAASGADVHETLDDLLSDVDLLGEVLIGLGRAAPGELRGVALLLERAEMDLRSGGLVTPVGQRSGERVGTGATCARRTDAFAAGSIIPAASPPTTMQAMPNRIADDRGISASRGWDIERGHRPAQPVL